MGVTLQGGLQLTVPVYPRGLLYGDREQPLQDIFEESATQKYHLGSRLELTDGRVFRYAKNGGTQLSKALMTSSEAAYAYVVQETQSTYGANADVGDLEIDIDVTAGGTFVENEFADGFLINESGTATCIGDMYKIVANKIDGSDDTLMRVRLETPIRVAWDASSVITLVKSPWRDVDVMPVTAEGTPAGVPLIDVTINYYCWLQTRGYCPLIVDTAEDVVKGEPVGFPADPAVPGACGPIGADTDAYWGICITGDAGAAAATIVDLKLE